MAESLDIKGLLARVLNVDASKRERVKRALGLAEKVCEPYREMHHESTWGRALTEIVKEQNSTVVADKPTKETCVTIDEVALKEETVVIEEKVVEEKKDVVAVKEEKKGVIRVAYDDSMSTSTVEMNNLGLFLKTEIESVGSVNAPSFKCRMFSNDACVVESVGASKKKARAAAANAFIKHFVHKEAKKAPNIVARGMCERCDCFVKLEGHELRCRFKAIDAVKLDPMKCVVGDTVFRLIMVAIYEGFYEGPLDFTTFAIPYERASTQAVLCRFYFDKKKKAMPDWSAHHAADYLEASLVSSSDAFRFVVDIVLFLFYLEKTKKKKVEDIDISFLKKEFFVFVSGYRF